MRAPVEQSQVLKIGERFQTIMPIYDKDILNDLLKSDVNVKGVKPEEQSFLASIFISWFPMILLIGVWIFFMRQMQGGGGKGACLLVKAKHVNERRSN